MKHKLFSFHKVIVPLLAAGISLHSSATSHARQWEPLGPGASEVHASGDYSAIAVDSNKVAYIAYQDFTNGNRLGVKKFDGNNWINVGGQTISDGGAMYVNIEMDRQNAPWVIYYDTYLGRNRVTVKRFNGTEWDSVGLQRFTAGNSPMAALAFAPDNTPYITFVNYATGVSGKATVMRFNGSTWVDVGSPFSIGAASYPRIKVDNTGTPYVAYADGGAASNIFVQKFNGTNWDSVGTRLTTTGSFRNISLEIDNNNMLYVGYADVSQGNRITVKKFESGTWNTVGVAGFSPGALGVSATNALYNFMDMVLDYSGQPIVAYADADSSYRVTVIRFNGSQWEILGSHPSNELPGKAISINTDNKGSVYIAHTLPTSPWPVHALQYDLCIPSDDTIKQATCRSIDFHDTTIGESGIYYFNHVSYLGCDSIITLDLTVHHVEEPIITTEGFILRTSTSYESYQWLLDGVLIPEAIHQSYNVRSNGSYSVIVVDDNGCIDTSEAYIVNNWQEEVSISQQDRIERFLKVYPNPAKDIINIDYPSDAQMELNTALGRTIHILKVSPGKHSISIADLPPGLYFLKVRDNYKQSTVIRKIMKL